MSAGRARAALLNCLSIVLLATPSVAFAQQDTSLTEIGVEVKVEHGPDSLLIGLQRADSVVLLPLRQLLGLLEIRSTEVVPGKRFAARLGEPPIPFAIRAEDSTCTRGNLRFPLAPGDAVWQGDELYVATPLLTVLLGTEVVMDWSELMVRFDGAASLPVVQRLARERRRAVMLRRGASDASVTDLTTAPPVLDGLAVDWSLTSSSREPLDNSTLQLGLGAAVLGGGLNVQTTQAHTPNGTTSETFATWSIAWDDRTAIRQLSAGDVITGGPHGFPVQGVNVGNVPYLRSATFATQPLFGRLPQGWEVEVYRGEELLGYTPTDTAGRYTVGVPVVYGQNPLETVAYGPGGEVRRSGRTFVVPFDRLPGRHFEWNLGGGACRGTRCQAAGNADLRYGVSDRLTIQGGMDAFARDSLDDLLYPYAQGSFAITRPLAFTAEYVGNALARGRFDLDPSSDLHLDLGYTGYDTSVTDPLIGSRLIARQAESNLFWRPGLMHGDLFIQAAAVWQEGQLRTRRELRTSATTRIIGARWALQGRYSQTSGNGGQVVLGAVDGSIDGIVTRGPAKNTFLRAAGSLECLGTSLNGCGSRITFWTVGVGRQFLRVFRFDFGLRKDFGLGGTSIDLNLTAGLPWMRATSRNGFSADGDYSGTQVFEGSVLWNRRQGKVDVANGRNLGRAGVVGVVFVDANGNGAQDRDEPGLPDVALRVGTNAVVTDSLGRFRAWDLVPFVNTTVEVDTLSLANPLWYPVAAIQRLPPSPNAFRFVSVPVREGGEVNGRVEFDGRPLSGARVVLTDQAGRVHEVTTFSDGAFYVMRLAPGSYEVRVSPDLVSSLRSAQESVYIRIPDSGVMRVDDVVLRVRRRS